MKNFALLVLYCFGTFFYFKTNENIVDFAQKQNKNYDIVKTNKKSDYTSLIDKQKLHFDKKEILLKAKHTKAQTSNIGMGIYTKVNLWQYSFENQQKRRTIQDSILACLPPKCNKTPNSKKQTDLDPSIFIFCDTILYIAKTSCDQANNDWKMLNKNLVETFVQKGDSILVSDCKNFMWKLKSDFIVE